MKEKDESFENDENNNILKIFKVCLVGESGVGKTCIINRFVNDEFREDEPPSISASYSEKFIQLDEYEGKTVKFHIWDTAGQEKYRSIGKIFYKDANAAILVYDITSQKTFDEIKNYWYKEIKDHTPENTNKYYYFY